MNFGSFKVHDWKFFHLKNTKYPYQNFHNNEKKKFCMKNLFSSSFWNENKICNGKVALQKKRLEVNKGRWKISKVELYRKAADSRRILLSNHNKEFNYIALVYCHQVCNKKIYPILLSFDFFLWRIPILWLDATLPFWFLLFVPLHFFILQSK